MERTDRRRLRVVSAEIDGWTQLARSVIDERAHVTQAADDALRNLRGSVVDTAYEGTRSWRILPLRPRDGRLLADIAAGTHLPPVAAATAAHLTALTHDVVAAQTDLKAVAGARRLFSGTKKREAGHDAAAFLLAYHDRGSSTGLPRLIESLRPPAATDHIAVADALADWVGLTPRLDTNSSTPRLITIDRALTGLPAALGVIDRALQEENRYRTRAIEAGNAVRKRDTRRVLTEMPVERLKDSTRGRLRIAPLVDAGIATVQGVLDHRGHLEDLPGIGPTTATQIRGAAQSLWQTMYDETPPRIDIKNRTPEVTEFLRQLNIWDSVRRTKNATSDIARAKELASLGRALDPEVTHCIVVTLGNTPLTNLYDAVRAVTSRAELITRAASAHGPRAADPWADFQARPADYYALLSELGFLTDDDEKVHGDLSTEIIDAVRALDLNTQHLSASLRGYQSFAARFALVQRKVIIGDEMGLGKTVEALAVLAHLRAKGSHHSLVVCPAAVVTNWIREATAKTTLPSHRIHGPSRATALKNWIRRGGMAVTTFDTLTWLDDQPKTLPEITCVVVDEAHYIKNPAAQRTRRCVTLLNNSTRAVLLTGTPLENRIDEFRNLVGYLRPDLVIDSTELTPARFRRQVAPAYLRRNQHDVLTELPELVEVDEWLPLSDPDRTAYTRAVQEGNFMAMRQAAMLQGPNSAKMQRLLDIVGEAEDNGRRVLVFSHFRAIIEHVARALPGPVFGPLTGSVPAHARQTMVDQFSSARHGAVLVAQIVAGGVGLNIQSASVVIICEPQLKPTTEWQAIARVRRMGQLDSVQVHRLLTDEGVDQRISEILAKKRVLFDDFARTSDTAHSAPEAFDISETELAREVIAAERKRLFT